MPPDALVLGFDTSAAHCAAALLSGDRVLAARQEDMAKGQAERLMGLLEEVLAEGGATWGDLARLGVGIGPGNFTGIRISVSAARGLALGLSIPAVGVSIPEAMVLDTPGPCGVMIDARGGRTYQQAFRDGVALGPVALCEGTTLIDLPGPDPVLVGAEVVTAGRGLRAVPPRHPVAEAIARRAAMAVPDGTRPAPLYVRAPDADPPRDPAPVLLP